MLGSRYARIISALHPVLGAKHSVSVSCNFSRKTIMGYGAFYLDMRRRRTHLCSGRKIRETQWSRQSDYGTTPILNFATVLGHAKELCVEGDRLGKKDSKLLWPQTRLL